VVILAKRKTDLDEKYYLLKTAYCLREHTKRKLRKEYESFHTSKKAKAPIYCYIRTSYTPSTLGR
jgi:site-specific DNA-adenine methylase